jgi:hypothetical protein
MGLGVKLAGFCRVMRCMSAMTGGRMRVMRCFFVVSGFMMFRCFTMMGCCLFVMVSGVRVMLRGFVLSGHGNVLLTGADRDIGAQKNA